jgi:hypothetical protein
MCCFMDNLADDRSREALYNNFKDFVQIIFKELEFVLFNCLRICGLLI